MLLKGEIERNIVSLHLAVRSLDRRILDELVM